MPNKEPSLTLAMARVKKGLSQEEVANRLDVSRLTYAAYEKYKQPMRIDKAYLFSEIVDIPFDDIIFFDKKYT